MAPLALTSGIATVSAAAPASASPPAAAPRSPLKLSLNGYSFNDQLLGTGRETAPTMDLFGLVQFCASHGFEALDPTGYYFPGYPAVPDRTYIHRLKRHAHRFGIAISGTGVRNDFATPDPAVRASGVALVKHWIEAAASLGAPVLRVFAGAVPAGQESKWDEVAAWMIPAFRECAEHGERHGVIIGVQNHADMLQTADQTIHVVEAVGSEWFGVVLDTGGMKTADPYADIARVVPYAVNWQVKESPVDRNSPVRTDLKRLFADMSAGGYRGYVPIETLPVDGLDYDPNVIVPRFAAEVRAAMDAAASA